MVIKTKHVHKTANTTEKRTQQGCQPDHRDFKGTLFTPVDEKQQQNQAHSGKTRKYSIWKPAIVLFRKSMSVSWALSSPPQIKQTGKSHIHDSLNEMSSVNTTSSTHREVAAVQKDWHACAHPRILTITPTTEHTQKMGLQSYQTRTRPCFCCCLENTQKRLRHLNKIIVIKTWKN